MVVRPFPDHFPTVSQVLPDLICYGVSVLGALEEQIDAEILFRPRTLELFLTCI
jgi:hypothetical protein